MANRTVKDAVSIKGTNPQYLIEKIIRTRIYDARYWKEDCFGLTAELLVDKAIELKSVGGIYGGNIKPTPFLCLILKMLQIQPEKDIIIEFIRNPDFKYVRALGAFYMRLTGTSVDIYKYLEPLYIDYRKMKRMNRSAKYELLHMDEFIDEILHSERMFDITLPRLQKRQILEEANELEPRISPLEDNLDDEDSSSDESDVDSDQNEKDKAKEEAQRRRKHRHSSESSEESDRDDRRRKEKVSEVRPSTSSGGSSRRRDEEHSRRSNRSRTRSRDRGRYRSRSRDKGRDRDRSKSRSRSRERSSRDHKDRHKHRH